MQSPVAWIISLQRQFPGSHQTYNSSNILCYYYYYYETFTITSHRQDLKISLADFRLVDEQRNLIEIVVILGSLLNSLVIYSINNQ